MSENNICVKCNGSGEGMHEGTKCTTCGGGGSADFNRCSYCEGVMLKKGKSGMHIGCWEIGKAENEE